LKVEVALPNLSEVPGVVLVEVDAHMMLATRATAAAGMLPVLACKQRRW
jgi:hypothetical protein